MMKAAPTSGVVARVKWEAAWKVLGSVSAAQKTLAAFPSAFIFHWITESFFIVLPEDYLHTKTCLRSALLFLWLWSLIFTKNWKIFVKIKSSSEQKFLWVLKTKKRSQIQNFWSWKCQKMNERDEEVEKFYPPKILCGRKGYFSPHTLIHPFYKMHSFHSYQSSFQNGLESKECHRLTQEWAASCPTPTLLQFQLPTCSHFPISWPFLLLFTFHISK